MVEWKKLTSVSNIQYGYPFESSLFTEDNNNIPLIRIRDIKPAKASTYYSGKVMDDYIVKKGDILVGMDGEFNLKKWNDRDGLLNQRVLKIAGKKDVCLDGFIYHYMGPVFKDIEKKTAGGSVKHLSAKVINSILIPIPSKAEQTRIVGILDTFTASIANLKAQIKERRKQYEYYRDKLIGNIEECKPVKQSCTIIKGAYITKNNTIPGNIPVILGGQEPAYYIDRYNHEGKAIVISRSGASAGYVSFWNEPIFVTDGFLLEPKSSDFLIEYLYYALKLKQTEIQNLKRGAGVPHITTNHINELIIPLPTKSEQSRIVNILDQFEASITNLEAQLAQREKQYEYYRNQLLTFE